MCCACGVSLIQSLRLRITNAILEREQSDLIENVKQMYRKLHGFDLPKSEYSRVFSGSRSRNLQMRGLCFAG